MERQAADLTCRSRRAADPSARASERAAPWQNEVCSFPYLLTRSLFSECLKLITASRNQAEDENQHFPRSEAIHQANEREGGRRVSDVWRGGGGEEQVQCGSMRVEVGGARRRKKGRESEGRSERGRKVSLQPGRRRRRRRRVVWRVAGQTEGAEPSVTLNKGAAAGRRV